MLDSWLPFLIYGLFALAIPASMIVIVVRLLDAAEAADARADDPVRVRRLDRAAAAAALHVSFYLTAMLFIVFDIEIVFLYPLAVVLDALGWFGVLRAPLLRRDPRLAYVYIWRKGALEWQ